MPGWLLIGGVPSRLDCERVSEMALPAAIMELLSLSLREQWKQLRKGRRGKMRDRELTWRKYPDPVAPADCDLKGGKKTEMRSD